MFIEHHRRLVQSSRKRGIRKRRLHAGLGVTIICDFSNNSGTLWGGLNLPSVHIL